MGLLVSIVILLMLGLGMFQAWQLWFTKREIARLEQRMAESLDDQDLLEFQERLQGLLAETKDAGLSLVQTLERRQVGVKEVVAKAEEAEKRLSIRTQLLELAARELTKGPAPKAAVLPPVKIKNRPKKIAKAVPAREGQETLVVEPGSPALTSVDAAARSSESTAEEAVMGYTSRPVDSVPGPNRYQRVYELADQGLSREQIARESGILPGEVDLILNLRPRKRR